MNDEFLKKFNYLDDKKLKMVHGLKFPTIINMVMKSGMQMIIKPKFLHIAEKKRLKNSLKTNQMILKREF